MKRFAREKAEVSLARLERQMAVVREEGAGVESVHDLRTGIRRLSECLRTFGGRSVPRRKLKKLMDAAAEVRNRDVAAELFRKAGVPEDDSLMTRLEAEREECAAALARRLRRKLE